MIKLWDLMDSSMHRKGWWLLMLIVCGMGLEVLSLAMIMPALGILIDPAFPQTHPWLASVLHSLGCRDQGQRIVAGNAFFAGAYGIKSICLAYLYWRQNCFVFDFQADLGRRLFHGYLRAPWNFHFQKNSSELIRNVVVETSNLAYLLLQLIQVLAEVLIVTGVVGLLLWVEPWGCVSILGAVFAGSWCFQRFSKVRSIRWGEQRKEQEDRRILHLSQGLGGFKEIRILGEENAFLTNFQTHNLNVSRLNACNGFLQMMPRAVLEFVAVVALTLFLSLMIFQDRNPHDLLLALGVFVAATFRIMPSATRILTAVQNARFYLPVVDVVQQELLDFSRVDAPQSKKQKAFVFHKEISVKNISFAYTRNNQEVLSNVSFRIPFGSSLAIIGENGSGKSTLLDIILGLLEPSAGKVLVDGRDIQQDLAGWQRMIGYIPQTVFLIDDSIEANILFGAKPVNKVALQQSVQLAGLEACTQGNPQGLKAKVGERGSGLSGGLRQRVGFARALYREPLLLVLDEPTSAQDTKSQEAVRQLLLNLKGKKTVILVTHEKLLTKVCEYEFSLKDKKIKKLNGKKN